MQVSYININNIKYLPFSPIQTPKIRLGAISPEGNNTELNQLPRSDSPSVPSQSDTFIQEVTQPIVSRRISSAQNLDKPLGLDQAIHYSIDSCGKVYCLLYPGFDKSPYLPAWGKQNITWASAVLSTVAHRASSDCLKNKLEKNMLLSISAAITNPS